MSVTINTMGDESQAPTPKAVCAAPEAFDQEPVSTSHEDTLQTSSVVLTPESSPIKERVTTTEVIETKELASQISSHCKLFDPSSNLSSPTITPQRIPKKKKGRRGRPKMIIDENSDIFPSPRRGRKKKSDTPEPQKTMTITDYFPVRRSERKTSKTLKKEQNEEIEDKIKSQCEDGLEIVALDGKGRGVVAKKTFNKGDFVVEYAGDLISMNDAKNKEKEYSGDTNIGCYMYYFIHKCKQYCIDATSESGKLGRLLNHSRTKHNCHTKVVQVGKLPHLILVASQEITEGEELLYDYGDRSKSSLQSHPWLKS